MTKAIDIINMLVGSYRKGMTNKLSIVLMIKFFLELGEITQQQANEYYSTLNYIDNKSTYILMQLAMPYIDTNFALDKSKIEEMIWFWGTYVNESNENRLTELEKESLNTQLQAL